METYTILMTGGTGLIGKWTAAALTRQGHPVRILARNPKTRKQDFLNWISSHGGRPEQIQLIEGDLTLPGLGISAAHREQVLQSQVVYHMGSAFEWGLSRQQAHRTTVSGTRELAQLLLHMPNLRQVIHLTGYMLRAPHIWSTLQLDATSFEHDQPLSTAQLDRLYQYFNAYEAAKVAAYFELARWATHHQLPLTNIELCTVAGHSQSGEILQPHGFPQLIYGVKNKFMPVIPGTPKDWIPLIAVDYLVQFITGIMHLPHTQGRDYLLLDERTPHFAQLVQLIASHLGMRPPTRHAPKWLVKTLLNLGLSRLSGLSAESLDFLQPYRFDTHASQQIANEMGLVMPDITSVITRTVDYLTESNFAQFQTA